MTTLPSHSNAPDSAALPFLASHLSGRWTEAPGGAGSGRPDGGGSRLLRDPLSGEAIARIGGAVAGLDEGFAFARSTGRGALQAMGYGERAAMLAKVGEVLKANREAYYAISLANSGTTAADSAVDIEGALFTLGWYAKAGAAFGDARTLLDGAAVKLSKDGLFQSQHVLAPVRGLALFVNAFNFPAWGLWEKAAPALLSGVPVVVKPATVTAWLTQRMVADVIAAGVLPPGALSIVCGSSAGLLDALQPFDVLSFTGSADTAATLRAHPAVARHGVRTNIEADSLNAAILAPDATPGTPVFDAFVAEVVREMRTKSGQRCTCIRRAIVLAPLYGAVAEAVSARLAAVTVGDPRHADVKMGSLVSREQHDDVQAGIAALRGEAQVLFDGSRVALLDADPAVAACVAPTLLGIADPAAADAANRVHAHEVFGPVATLIASRDTDHAIALAHRGQGSLVSSLYSADADWIARSALALAGSNGRVHAVSPEVAKTQTGHGNVMPQSVHGGPGRAGGGEELGGLRALRFYHRRSALQAPQAALERVAASAFTLVD